MKAFTTAAAILMSFPAIGADLTQNTPAFIQEMQAKGGNQELFLNYCLIGSHICERRQAIAFGDICNAWQAASMGYRDGPVKSGNLAGGEPDSGYHFSSWQCGEHGVVHNAQTIDELKAEEVKVHPEWANTLYSYSGAVGKVCAGPVLSGDHCASWVAESGQALGYCQIHNRDGSCASAQMTSAGVALARLPQ